MNGMVIRKSVLWRAHLRGPRSRRNTHSVSKCCKSVFPPGRPAVYNARLSPRTEPVTTPQKAPAEQRQGWRFGWALTGYFALFPAAAAAGALAFSPLQALAGLGAFRTSAWRDFAPRKAPAHFVAALFVVYAMATALWSIHASNAAPKTAVALTLGYMFATAPLSLSDRARALAGWVGVSAIVGAVALLGLETLFQDQLAPIFAAPGQARWRVLINLTRGVAVLSSLTWPAAAFLLSRKAVAARAAGVALILGVGALAVQFDDSANALAFMLGGLAFAIVRFAPVLCLRTLFLAAAATVVAAPAIASILPPGAAATALPFSWAARLDIWRYAAARIAERPLFGWGFDAAPAFPGAAVLRGVTHAVIGPHPHNAALQIWLEGGAVGACLAAAALVLGGWRAGAILADRPHAAAAFAAAATAYLAIASLDEGLWRDWWMVTPFTAAALMLLCLANPNRGPNAATFGPEG
jgi:O-antigen ligase